MPPITGDDCLRFSSTNITAAVEVQTFAVVQQDSMIIATGSADRNVKIWGLDFGDCHRSMFAHDDRYEINQSSLRVCPKMIWRTDYFIYLDGIFLYPCYIYICIYKYVLYIIYIFFKIYIYIFGFCSMLLYFKCPPSWLSVSSPQCHVPPVCPQDSPLLHSRKRQEDQAVGRW